MTQDRWAMTQIAWALLHAAWAVAPSSTAVRHAGWALSPPAWAPAKDPVEVSPQRSVISADSWGSRENRPGILPLSWADTPCVSWRDHKEVLRRKEYHNAAFLVSTFHHENPKRFAALF
jgi:hypothetical protein